MPVHWVEQGECLSSIADAYGFSSWRKSYEHPENRGFRRRRPDPNVIFPGDRIYIPDRDSRQESCSTEKRHRFSLHRPSTLLRLVLRDERREILAGVRYRLTVGDKTFDGRTNAEGLVEHKIPPDASAGQLTVWLPPRQEEGAAAPLNVDYLDKETGNGGAAPSGQPSDRSQQADTAERQFEWSLEIGCLDPMEEVTGVQARLANLGFSPGPVDGIQGELTAGAIRRFQRAYGLTVDGIAGPQTRAKLKEVHGC